MQNGRAKFDPKTMKGNAVNKWVVYALIFIGGVVAAPKVRTLPLLNKLPSA